MHPAYVDLIEVTWCTVVWCTGTERAEMAAVSRGTGHVSALSTPLRWIFKNVLKKKKKKRSHSCRNTCERSESARERGIALNKSDHHHHHQQQQQQS